MRRPSLPWPALLLCLLPGAAGAAVLREEGIAHASSGGAVLYRETHWLQGQAPSAARLVLYRCADGQPFARKWMPAPLLPQAPDYRFEDGRDGRTEAVHGDAQQRTVAIRVARDAPEQRTTLALPDGAVVDAGFDAAVRAHWPTLMRGEPVTLPFLLPSRQRWVPVQIRHAGRAPFQGRPAERLQLKLDAWFGFAVPAVTLLYDPAQQRLLQFNGTGNVRDARGRYPQVRIDFPAPPVAATQAELDRARTQPLVAACPA